MVSSSAVKVKDGIPILNSAEFIEKMCETLYWKDRLERKTCGYWTVTEVDWRVAPPCYKFTCLNLNVMLRVTRYLIRIILASFSLLPM